MKRLNVILGSEIVAELIQTDDGAHHLSYASLNSPSLSVALPNDGTVYSGRRVDPFLEGLLPDRDSVREALARRFGVSPRNPFALLEHIGLDCAGAVRFASDNRLEAALEDSGEIVPLTEEEIGARLGALEDGLEPSWIAPEEGWSLAGAQTKIALRSEQGRWYEARGSEPTTHILKPGISRMHEQALGEHLCLAALREAAIPASRTSYKSVGGIGVLVMERYDRYRDASGAVRRLHQEDLCQATGTYPHRKDESAGGPGAVDLIGLLDAWCTDSGASVRRFVDALIVNVLLGAPDAHAKNYSILQAAGHRVLAPLYDVASGLPYSSGADSFRSPGDSAPWRTSAMAIGGQRHLSAIGATEWTRLAEHAQLARRARMDGPALVARVAELSRMLPDALASVVAAERVGNPALAGTVIPERLLDAVAARCREARSLL